MIPGDDSYIVLKGEDNTFPESSHAVNKQGELETCSKTILGHYLCIP